MTTDIRKLPKQEQEYYLNGKNEIQYNSKCERCARDCKISFKSIIVYCPKEIKVKTKKRRTIITDFIKLKIIKSF